MFHASSSVPSCSGSAAPRGTSLPVVTMRCFCFTVYGVTGGSRLLTRGPIRQVCCLLHTGNIFLCYTHCVVTVIGKDLDSLSSWWTFNEALFMLQLRREKAEKRQTGPSRRADGGCEHFEVRERSGGLITRLCCHSCQLPYPSKKKSTAETNSPVETPPSRLVAH